MLVTSLAVLAVIAGVALAESQERKERAKLTAAESVLCGPRSGDIEDDVGRHT